MADPNDPDDYEQYRPAFVRADNVDDDDDEELLWPPDEVLEKLRFWKVVADWTFDKPGSK